MKKQVNSITKNNIPDYQKLFERAVTTLEQTKKTLISILNQMLEEWKKISPEVYKKIVPLMKEGKIKTSLIDFEEETETFCFGPAFIKSEYDSSYIESETLYLKKNDNRIYKYDYKGKKQEPLNVLNLGIDDLDEIIFRLKEAMDDLYNCFERVKQSQKSRKTRTGKNKMKM